MKEKVAQTPPSVDTVVQKPTSVDSVKQTPSSVLKPVDEFTITLRNLPHWQNPGSIYFITFRTFNNLILDDISKQIIYDNIIHYSKYYFKLFSFVIIPDHIHIILQPNEIENNSFVNLSKIMQAIKGYAAKQIIKHIAKSARSTQPAQTGASELPIKHIFQVESFDRIIRNDKELFEKMNYILNNSVKKGLVENGYEYKWYYLNNQATTK